MPVRKTGSQFSATPTSEVAELPQEWLPRRFLEGTTPEATAAIGERFTGLAWRYPTPMVGFGHRA